jgi:RNA polymerase sigma-70 factor (ECF subfamily)
MNDLFQDTERSWRRFLTAFEPLRPDLYRYCRYLTRSAWDAEDLAQDTLARAFAQLARSGGEPANPRAWLFRVASNLWIDSRRRDREILTEPAPSDDSAAEQARATREAAGTLLVRLAPQERAAVVLKDVFDFSLDDIAATLSTSIGAVKAALHRGRGKLVEPAPEVDERKLRPAALDAFCKAFNAADLDGLTALLLDNAVVEVSGATTMHGPDAARRTVLNGMLFGTRYMVGPKSFMDPEVTAGVLPVSPRVEARFHRGRWVLVHWYQHEGGIEAVRAFTTVTVEGDRVAHLVNHFYNPELLLELGAEMQVPVRVNGYRWCPREPS